MPFIISKEFAFEAAHHLTKVPEGHKCRRPHGHSYRVIVELQADTLDERGFVVDYTDLEPIKSWLDSHWDHQDLNVWFEMDEYGGVESTAENLCKFLYDEFKGDYPEMTAIRVSETAKTWAEYRP